MGVLGGRVVGIRTGVPGMTETKVEAARIRWHEHQTEHGCTSLTCAEAQLKYQEYLAAIREDRGDASGADGG